MFFISEVHDISRFCPKCGALRVGRKLSNGGTEIFCARCEKEDSLEIEEEEVLEVEDEDKSVKEEPSIDVLQPESTEETESSLIDQYFHDKDFLQKKLKPLLRSGRATKPIRSLSRKLNIPEIDLHELFKLYDNEGKLPYGYYDKIERNFIRTHQEEEIDPDLLLDLIHKSFGSKVFHHQGLTSFIRMGRNISSRRVYMVLHTLRKDKKLIGFKKGSRWLWRLPCEDDSDEDLEVSAEKEQTIRRHKRRRGQKFKEEKEPEPEKPIPESKSLAELTKDINASTENDLDDDDDFEIVFTNVDEEE